MILIFGFLKSISFVFDFITAFHQY